MPKAAVNKHRNLCSREYEVSAASNSGQDQPVNPISEAPCVQRSSELELSLGIPLPGLRHPAAYRL